MWPLSKIVLLGGIALVAYDAIISLLSKKLGFRYAYAAPGSFAIYAVAGYFAVQIADASSAFFAGAALGAIDATIGWAVAWILGPGRVPSLTMLRWLTTAVVVCTAAAVCAGLGALAYSS